MEQGDPSTSMFMLHEGDIQRLRKDDEGQLHQVDTKKCGTTINSLHILRKDPVYATAHCLTPVIAYELTSEDLNSLLSEDKAFTEQVIYSLTREIRTQTKKLRTPLLEQHAKENTMLAPALGAAIESFYRSGLNSILNRQLTGIQGPLFPQMHIQTPTRVAYITGLKTLRRTLDEKIKPDEYSNPTAVRVGVLLAPGLIMSPLPGVLEAANVTKMNPEPMWYRWTR